MNTALQAWLDGLTDDDGTNAVGTVWGKDDLLSMLTAIETAIAPTWTAYTPTWASSGTQPALGNGTLTGRYLQMGKIVFYDISLIWGSTSTPGTGAWTFSTPVTAANTVGQAGSLYILDSGTQHFTGAIYVTGTTTFSMATTNAANVSTGVPMTWATGDTLRASGFFVAA
jgi:hypothetical protein